MLERIHFFKAIYHASNAPFWLRSMVFVWHGMDVLLDPLLYVVLAGVMLLEWRMPAIREQRRLSTGLRQDVFWFVGDRLAWLGALALVVRGAELFYRSHLSFLSIDVGSHLPPLVRIVYALLLYDFLWWGLHYLKHRVSWLWAFHAVHHSQPEMNMFTDFRVHGGERVINTVMLFIPLSMFHVGMPTAFHIAVFFDWYRAIYHANIRTNFGPLKYILVTPQFHRIHHSSEAQHADRNFGIIFSFWDRLFGTHWDGYEDYPVCGLIDEGFPVEQSSNFGVIGTWVQQTAYPVLALVGWGAGMVPNLEDDGAAIHSHWEQSYVPAASPLYPRSAIETAAVAEHGDAWDEVPAKVGAE